MKASWPMQVLGDVCEIRHGANHKGVEAPDGRYPIYGSGGPMGFAKEYRCPAKTVLIGRKGTLNKPILVQTPCWNIDTAYGLIPSETIHSSYLFYFCLKTDFTTLNPYSGRPSTTATSIAKIPIPLPALPEQKRIVGILDAAFEKIDAVQRNAERNLANAKELFQRVLDEEMTPKSGNKLFNLKDIAAIFVGYAFKSSGYSTDPHDLKLVCGDNIEPGFFRWDETKYWPRKNVAQYSQFLLKTDDVVLAMDRPWIKSGLKRALVTEDVLPALLLQRTACLRTGDKDIARYLYFILGSSFFVEHVLNQQTPGSVPHISGKQIASFPLYLPEEKRIHSAVQRISTLYEATQTEESKYRRLLSLCAELKRQILAKAFNGEL